MPERFNSPYQLDSPNYLSNQRIAQILEEERPRIEQQLLDRKAAEDTKKAAENARQLEIEQDEAIKQIAVLLPSIFRQVTEPFQPQSFDATVFPSDAELWNAHKETVITQFREALFNLPLKTLLLASNRKPVDFSFSFNEIQTIINNIIVNKVASFEIVNKFADKTFF